MKILQGAWERFILLHVPPAIRKVIYTTNSIESFDDDLRKVTRNRVQFTNNESALKMLWLMVCSIEDRRVAQRAKYGKRVAATSGGLVEGAEGRGDD